MRALRQLTAVVLCAGAGCDDAPKPAAVAEAELPLIYAAVLSDSADAVAPRVLALGLDLMSDSGTYETSGRLPEAVVHHLLEQRIISELCTVTDSTGRVPDCVTQHATRMVRMSRLLQASADSVRVYLGGGSIQPSASPTEFYLPFGYTVLLTLARRAGRWQVVAKETIMIT